MPAKIAPLSNVDAAWLKMEDPTNLMMVTGVMTFRRPVDMGHFRALIETRFLTFERFRQRIGKSRVPFTPPYWEADPHFNLDAHLHRLALPQPGDKAALQELVSDMMSTPLDFSKPLWHMHVVDNYGSGSAIVVRLHHCIADGMALVGVLLALTDLNPNAPRPLGRAIPLIPPTEPKGRLEAPLETLGSRAAGLVKTGQHLGRRALIESLETFLNNDRPRQLAEQGADYAYALSRLVLRSSDPKTVFKGKLGVAKRAAWSDVIPLQEVKAIRKALGGTINDIMVTAVTGGLRRYMLEHGEEVEGVAFRAAVPFNLRKPNEMGEMGNKFGLVFLDLPVDIADTRERLQTVRHRMENLKESAEAPVSLDILATLGFSPDAIQDIVVKIFGAKATTVLTNVPGPPIPLYLAGQPIETVMFWVPQSGRLGLGISIISYAGGIAVGIATDEGLVADPERIVDGFCAEFQQMRALAGV